MTETHKPTDRLVYTGDLKPLIGGIAEAYGVGVPISHSVVEVGYEDCNVIIETDQDRYLAKMFAKTRKPEEVIRYTDIMQKVVAAGVNHPELIATGSGKIVHTESGVSLVLMRFIEGKTFFDLDRAPRRSERHTILEQAAKINAIDYEPPYLFDSWAIPNIGNMFERVKQFIEPDDLVLVEQAMAQYNAIPVSELPHAFVHGDFTKTNILRDNDGNIYVLDFSVANRYPRIQELAVIAANLLHDKDDTITLRDRCAQVADEYGQFAELTESERRHLPAYALAGVAMEFMGAHQEKFINGNDTEETDYWLDLGRSGLHKALRK